MKLCEKEPGCIRLDGHGLSCAFALAEEAMTPAEVIAMRDRLAEWLTTECKDNSDVLAESLIKSGWVVAPPKNEGESDG